VDDELPVRFDVEIAALGAPIGVIEPVEIRDAVGIGKRRIAHPYPQPVVALDHRIGLDLRGRRNGVLARDPHALAGAVVAQAMVMALQMVADELAHGQRQMAVDATVLERSGRAVLLAEEHDRLTEDHPPERLARNLVVVGGDVPEILKEHGVPPSPSYFGKFGGSIGLQLGTALIGAQNRTGGATVTPITALPNPSEVPCNGKL